jgi:serine phosphatase RsbU (regulator of sigma subunit)
VATVKDTGRDSAAHFARLRHQLLRASTVEAAVDAGVTALRDLLDLAAESTVTFVRSGAAPEVDEAEAHAFRVCSAGGVEHGTLLVGGRGLALSDATGDDARVVADDLAHALDNAAALAAAREVSRLRAALEGRDHLVRQAGDALIRDAHEVVRVVAELEKRDAIIHEDLQQALRFQNAMISPLPARLGIAMSALHLAAETISGDFYDVTFVTPETLRIFVADATGHGIAAGLATMFIKSEYEAEKRDARRPAAILSRINERLAAAYRNLELQFTALCIDVDVSARRMVFASAAHPAPILLRAGRRRPLESGGPFVGVMTGVEFPEHEVALDAGDMLVAFSDGLLDATSAEGVAFGEAAVTHALASAQGDGSEACPALVRALAAFVGEGRGLPDDVTVVALSLAASDGRL